jgi:hypothetical protein
MAYIISLIVALAAVVILGLALHGNGGGGSAYAGGFRHVTAQTDTLVTSANQGSAFQVMVFHPPARTDFASVDEPIRTLASPRSVEIRHYASGSPETMQLMNRLRVRMGADQTVVVIQAPNGALTWGGPEETIAKLNTKVAFPSDRMSEIIKAAQRGKDVLLVFSGERMANGTQLVQAASDYVLTPANKAEAFVIDPDDPANSEIIARTNMPPDSLRDARMLMMVGGQVKGQLTRAANATDIQALKKSCSGKAGCC